jgi:hypothetical protein
MFSQTSQLRTSNLKLFSVKYVLCGQLRERIVLAKDDVRAWIVVWRSHHLPACPIEVQEVDASYLDQRESQTESANANG